MENKLVNISDIIKNDKNGNLNHAEIFAQVAYTDLTVYEEKEVDFQLDLLSKANEYFFVIDNYTYKLNLESNECCKELLKLANFDLQKFINNCLEKIDEDNNKDDSSGTTNTFSLSININSSEIKLVGPKEKKTDVEDIKEYIKTSKPNNEKINGNNTDLSFFLIFLSIFFGIPLADNELKEIQDEFIKKQETPSPTVDECLAKIEEAEKQKAKSQTL